MRNPDSKNVRRNIASMVSFRAADGEQVNIMIDCGKSFREGAVHAFPRLGITHLSGVLLTHPHADAVLGLDDIRDASPGVPLDVYLTASTYTMVQRAFPYLIPSAAAAANSTGMYVASLRFHVIEPYIPFIVRGCVILPIPVLHGSDPCMAFEICGVLPSVATSTASAAAAAAPSASASASRIPRRVVYISDVQAITGETRAWLKAGSSTSSSSSSSSSGGGDSSSTSAHGGDVATAPAAPATDAATSSDGGAAALPAAPYAVGPIDLCFVDALAYKAYPTHFSYKQAVGCMLDLQPSHAVFLGSSHRVDYYAEQPKIAAFGQKHGMTMEMGYDCWESPMELPVVPSLEAVAAAVTAVRAAVPDADKAKLYNYKDTAGCEEWEDGQSPSASADVPTVLRVT